MGSCFLKRTNLAFILGFPSGSVVKNPSAMQEMQETCFDPRVGKMPWLKAWRSTLVFFPEIPWTEEPGRFQSTGLSELDMTE